MKKVPRFDDFEDFFPNIFNPKFALNLRHIKGLNIGIPSEIVKRSNSSKPLFDEIYELRSDPFGFQLILNSDVTKPNIGILYNFMYRKGKNAKKIGIGVINSISPLEKKGEITGLSGSMSSEDWSINARITRRISTKYTIDGVLRINENTDHDHNQYFGAKLTNDNTNKELSSSLFICRMPNSIEGKERSEEDNNSKNIIKHIEKNSKIIGGVNIIRKELGIQSWLFLNIACPFYWNLGPVYLNANTSVNPGEKAFTATLEARQNIRNTGFSLTMFSNVSKDKNYEQSSGVGVNYRLIKRDEKNINIGLHCVLDRNDKISPMFGIDIDLL